MKADALAPSCVVGGGRWGERRGEEKGRRYWQVNPVCKWACPSGSLRWWIAGTRGCWLCRWPRWGRAAACGFPTPASPPATSTATTPSIPDSATTRDLQHDIIIIIKWSYYNQIIHIILLLLCRYTSFTAILLHIIRILKNHHITLMNPRESYQNPIRILKNLEDDRHRLGESSRILTESPTILMDHH